MLRLSGQLHPRSLQVVWVANINCSLVSIGVVLGVKLIFLGHLWTHDSVQTMEDGRESCQGLWMQILLCCAVRAPPRNPHPPECWKGGLVVRGSVWQPQD